MQKKEVQDLKKFTTDNRFFDYMGSIGDWMILNILFILTCLPIVTIGMSLTAFYQVSMRRVRGESNYVVREYIQACKKEWRQSTKLWMIFLLTGALLLFDILYSKNLSKTLSIAIGCIAAIWCFVISYVFPLQARFENTIKNTVINAFWLSIKNLPYTIIMVLLNSIPFLCIALGAFIVQMAMPIYCLIGFSLTAQINSIMLTKIFKLVEEQEEKNENTAKS